MKNKFGLTESQNAILLENFQPYSQYIEKVGVFGSRATGTYKPYSDIDLVLYGQISTQLVDRLFTLFSDSLLPISVDLQAYDLIKNPLLKTHIDTVSQILFDENELRP